MAKIVAKMTSIGNEPQTCTKPFARGELMNAVEYANGDKAGWHNQECVEFWKKTGKPKCMENADGSKEAFEKLQLCSDGLLALYDKYSDPDPELSGILLGLHQLIDEAIKALQIQQAKGGE